MLFRSGLAAMFTMMNNARLNVGLQGVQIAEGAMQKAISFAQERVQSARAGGPSRDPVPINDHPDVRRMLLRMKAGTQAVRALLYFASAHVDKAALGIEDAQEMVDLLTPLAKLYGTDMGEEIASLGVQVHGGMGYVEETGAAQFYRDIRITQIYEGTNGIQAADLVGRKLGMRGGDALRELMDQVGRAAGDHAALKQLSGACGEVLEYMVGASIDDRLAGSYPFTTMVSVAVSGMLMARQLDAAQAETNGGGASDFLKSKIASCRYYLEVMVPEATGLKHSAMNGADLLYSLDTAALSA